MGKMNEPRSDFEWLQQFALAGNQNAFRELVRRHIELVFATALHKLGDAGVAEEISQNVFGVLARKAWQFAPDDSLPAWLHKTTVLESKSWLRGEMRRGRREQTAAELGTTMKTSHDQPAFNALVPLLDDGLLSLRERDRAALLLRYYEKRSLREVGGLLGVSEDTAQKRVQTALEKLSDFFQRRGFKTATVTAAAAALQHTSASVSAATASSIAGVALQAAPPVLVGVGAWLARMAAMTKVQTAVICLIVAAAPVSWQWNRQREAAANLTQINASLADAQSEFSSLQTEVERLRGRSAKLDAKLADATSFDEQREAKLRQFEAWKKRLRGQLLAADYHWPDDSPFVRIPKAVVAQLEVLRPVTQPGVIKQEARELLGLTPQERETAEAALQKYFADMDKLMESNRYETNSAKVASVPANVLASQVFGLPALGDGVKQLADDLQASLRADLGEERWPMVASQMESSGTDTLRRILNLDAGDRGQELAVWIQDQNGTLVAGYGWGDHTSSFSSGGLALRFFLPGAQFPDGASIEDYMDVRQLSPTLTGPALEWIRQQAEIRLEKKGGL